MPQTRGASRDRIIDSTLALIAERGWQRTGLADIAQAAGLNLAQLHRHFESKDEILLAHMARIDDAMLKGRAATGESPRQRLEDVLMHRFKVMGPYRAAHRALRRGLIADPVAGLKTLLHLRHALRWALEAAGIESGGRTGRLRLKGLGVIYLATLCVWFNDDSDDLAGTRAELDKHLRRAERLARWLPQRQPEDGQAGPAPSAP